MQCLCDIGYKGEFCQNKDCTLPCLNKGKCIDGACFCEIGWSGQFCEKSIKIMINLESCFHNCSGNGECIDGKCNCNELSTGVFCQNSKYNF